MVEIDGARLLRDLEELARIGETPDGGVDRTAFNGADQEGRDLVAEWMTAAGMTVRTDGVGNTIATYPGSDSTLAPIALGSHTDSVPNGGRYDGSLGVLAGIACVRALQSASVQLRHPVEVINFVAEEATVGGGTLGSRAMVGSFDPATLDQTYAGRTVTDHLQRAGIDPSAIASAARPAGSLAAYLELHIEQGGHLETAGVPVGIVEGIVGIRRYRVVFSGYANHAGTTPMDGRRDALVMAAPFVLTVRDTALKYGIVGTIGSFQVYPGAPNVIPGRVEVSVEIRAMDEALLDQAQRDLDERAQAMGGVFSYISQKPPVVSDPQLLAALDAACEETDLPHMQLPSGAGHDAMCMADITRQAMVFVRSRGGVSHSPDEFTSADDCVAGAQVLLATLLRLDTELDGASDE